MPCYLFTYHAYGTWLPDRRQGYVQRHSGILPQDNEMAARYRARMTEAEKVFNEEIQQSIITALLESRDKQQFECYFVATDPTHVHVLLAWRDEREWLRMRSTVKGSISRLLNHEHGRCEWFAERGSRKRVCNRDHFGHLFAVYLPQHRGWKWSESLGFHV